MYVYTHARAFMCIQHINKKIFSSQQFRSRNGTIKPELSIDVMDN